MCLDFDKNETEKLRTSLKNGPITAYKMVLVYEGGVFSPYFAYRWHSGLNKASEANEETLKDMGEQGRMVRVSSNSEEGIYVYLDKKDAEELINWFNAHDIVPPDHCCRLEILEVQCNLKYFCTAGKENGGRGKTAMFTAVHVSKEQLEKVSKCA